MRAAAAPWAPRVELSETDAEIRVAAELPGFEEKQIEVGLEDDVLTIRGERAAEEPSGAGTSALHVERRRGRFERSLRLPAEVDPDAVRAVYRNGVLTVTLPKAPAARVRSIPVTTA